MEVIGMEKLMEPLCVSGNGFNSIPGGFDNDSD